MAVVAVDALTKALAAQALGPASQRDAVWLVENRLGFEYGENSGIAFGFLQGRGLVVLVASVIALAALAVVLPRIMGDSRWNLVAAALLAGGAIGNVIDRIRFGSVRDFIVLGPIPPFNVADAALTIGVTMIALSLIRRDAAEVSGAGFRGSVG